MSQESLFYALDYVRDAYEALVMAYSNEELEEIKMLKSAVLRCYVGLRDNYDEMRLPLPPVDADDMIDAPF